MGRPAWVAQDFTSPIDKRKDTWKAFYWPKVKVRTDFVKLIDMQHTNLVDQPQRRSSKGSQPQRPRGSFHVNLSMLLILLSMLDTVQPASLVRPRYAVFGGSGFIGSRVCKALVEAGCSVASISRTGKCPEWATEVPWSAQVNWLAADMLSPPAQLAAELGAIDGAVSCVGNMRPSPTWRDFFGLHWDYESLTRENGLVTWRI